MNKSLIRIHVLGAMPKGNVGTIAAQRALYKMLKNIGNVDLSISTSNVKVFKQNHPEFEDKEIYEPLTNVFISAPVYQTRSYTKWTIFTLFNLIIFTFIALLTRIGVPLNFNKKIIKRMKECDVHIDLNLELLRGIPISLSKALVKRRPIVLVIHKLFWSCRIIFHLWFIFIVKSIFRKKVVIGPASYGPFNDLPIITQKLTKLVLNRFIDLLLVREPCSAKILDKLGVHNYQLLTDVALMVEADIQRNVPNGNQSSTLTIGVAPAMLRYTLTKEEINNYVEAHAKCLDTVIETLGATIVFLPSSIDDIAMCDIILTKMNHKHYGKIVINESLECYESWIKKLDLLITTRMHPSIIAARNIRPFLSIIYDHKQTGLLHQLGLDSLSIKINEVSYDNLKSLLDHIIKHQSEIKGALESAILKLQSESKLKAKYVFLKLLQT